MSPNSCMTGQCQRVTTKCGCVPCMTKRRAACRFGLRPIPRRRLFVSRLAGELGTPVQHSAGTHPVTRTGRIGGAGPRSSGNHELDGACRTGRASRGTDGGVLRHAGAEHIRSSSRNPGAADQRGRGTLRQNGGRIRAECVRPDSRAVRVCEGRNPRQFFYCRFAEVGAGVCQDFAHLLLGVLRKRGIPARYVSGYLVPQNENNPAAKLEEVIGGQASHAWAEAYIPDSGWVPLDPTLGKPVGMRHVRVAYGRDYADVAPVRGVYKGHAGQRLSVDVSVRPAIDDEGNERMAETTAIPSEPEPVEPRAQQGGQQQ